MIPPVTLEQIEPELVITTARSGGPGGQHVNKVSSKVIIRFDVTGSTRVSDEQKALLLRKLVSRLTLDGVLVVAAQESRSQHENKQKAYEKLSSILEKAFLQPKRRKPTKPTKASKTKRIQSKKQHAEKKKWRQRPV